MYTLITLDIDAMNYFRAILKLRESSPRALALTKHLITLNPSNYTLWQYRREILQNEDLESEQNFINKINQFETNKDSKTINSHGHNNCASSCWF